MGYIRDVTSERHAQEMASQKREAELLLQNMLPMEIAQRLVSQQQQKQRAAAAAAHIAEHYHAATILFADIAGFTSLSNQLTPLQVVTFLNDIFCRFDACLERYHEFGLNKIKTIGKRIVACVLPLSWLRL